MTMSSEPKVQRINLRDITIITEDGREVRLADTAEVRLSDTGDVGETVVNIELATALRRGYGVGFTLPPSAWAWANYVVKSIFAAAEAKDRAAAEEKMERGENEERSPFDS